MKFWGKSFWDTPIRTFIMWAFVGYLFYLTFWLGVDYGRTNQPFYDKVFTWWRTPFSCAPRPPSNSPTVDYYTILMARFLFEEQAVNFRTKLAAERINSRVMVEGRGYFVVVGKFTSLGQARDMLAVVRQKGYRGAVILSPINSRF